MNVLITSASRKVSLIRAFQLGLLRAGGGRVVAADLSPLSAALYAADTAEHVPRSDAPEFLDVISGICERHGIGLIVPTRDEELPVFAAARPDLEKLGVQVAVADLEVIETCQDKAAFHAFCVRHGLGMPRTYDAARAEFPAFVKPRRGKGGRGIAIVHDDAELREAADRSDGELIIQELIEAPEYTIDLLADFEGNVVSIVPRRRLEVVGGESWIGQVDMRDELLQEARRLCEAMLFRGPVTIQCFLTSAGVVFIEVNPRFGGAAALGWAAGAPTPEYLVHLARGEAVRHDPALIRDGLMMLRHTDDIFITPTELAHGVPQ